MTAPEVLRRIAFIAGCDHATMPATKRPVMARKRESIAEATKGRNSNGDEEAFTPTAGRPSAPFRPHPRGYRVQSAVGAGSTGSPPSETSHRCSRTK